MLLGALALASLALGCATARRANAPAPLTRIAFGSCAHQDHPQPIWDAVLAAEPDLFIFLGDNVYADTTDFSTMRAIYDRQAAVPGWRRLRAMTEVVATWDDHDYGENDGGADFTGKEGAKEEFLRFFEIPRDAPVRGRPGVYSARVFGPPARRVQVILLDTRTFRGPLIRRPEHEVDSIRGRYLPQTDPTVSMLGERQWQWLEQQLRQPAVVRLLVSSVQLAANDHGWEKWGNLPHERLRLLELLRSSEAGGVIVLSGDRHLAEISRLETADGAPYTLYDVTSSGLNMSGGGYDDEPNRFRVGENFRKDNFGFLEIDWAARDPVLRIEIRDVEGDAQLAADLRLSQLAVP
jgi:alkaline phosphatase D